MKQQERHHTRDCRGMRTLRISLLMLALPICGFGQQSGDASSASLPTAPAPQATPQTAGSTDAQM